MTPLARAAGFAAALMMIAASGIEAQSSSVRVTLTGGPHAGTYELKRDQCDALDGQIISMFTPETPRAAAGSSVLKSIELYTEPANGKPHGFAVNVEFRSKSGHRIKYEIYAIPPELQGPGGRTTPPSGRGSVTIRKEQTVTIAEFRGETKDGVRMDGRVDCGKR